MRTGLEYTSVPYFCNISDFNEVSLPAVGARCTKRTQATKKTQLDDDGDDRGTADGESHDRRQKGR